MDHSEIAKSGYANEHWLVDLINHKPNSASVRSFLSHIGWDNVRYTKPTAYRKGGTEKADIGIDFWRKDNDWPDSHYISCKKIESSNHNGLGHIHKTTVESYQSKWNFDNIIKRCLDVYCGNILYENQKGLYFEHVYYKPYRMYISNFFSDNVDTILSDLFKGKSLIKPSWFTVTLKTGEDSRILYLFDIEDVIRYAKGDGKVYYGKNTTKQNLCIGNIMMYSKRSDGQLQFKMNYKPMLKTLGNRARIFYF